MLPVQLLFNAGIPDEYGTQLNPEDEGEIVRAIEKLKHMQKAEDPRGDVDELMHAAQEVLFALLKVSHYYESIILM